MPSWFYQPSDVTNVVGFAVIIGLLIIACIFTRDYFRSLSKRRQELRRGFEVLHGDNLAQRSDKNAGGSE